MITYMVNVSFRGSTLLNEYCDNLSEAHMLAQGVGINNSRVEIWEGFIDAGGIFNQDQLIYCYDLDNEDGKDV